MFKESIPILTKALQDDNVDVATTAAETLGEVGSPDSLQPLQFAAQNQFKNDAKVRAASEQALAKVRLRAGEETWNTVRRKAWYENLSRVRTRALARWLLRAFGLFALFELLAALFGPLVSLFKTWRVRIGALPFFGTGRVLVPLTKSERTTAERVQTFLRFGFNGPDSTLTAMFGVGLTVAALMGVGIFSNVFWTWSGAIGTWAILCVPYFLMLSAPGARWEAKQTNRVRVSARAFGYPFRYFSLADQYADSGAMFPEHFYLMQRFQKEQGSRIFDELRKSCEKFPQPDRAKVFGSIVGLAYRMSQRGKDPRDILETQGPVAIDVSSDYRSFESSLARQGIAAFGCGPGR